MQVSVTQVSPAKATPAQFEEAIAQLERKAATVRAATRKHRDFRKRHRELLNAATIEGLIEALRDALKARRLEHPS